MKFLTSFLLLITLITINLGDSEAFTCEEGWLQGPGDLQQYCYNILVPSMSFYPDFILILSRFYPNCIQILSKLYPNFIQLLSKFNADFIQILSRVYPDFIPIFKTLTLSKFYPNFIRNFSG